MNRMRKLFLGVLLVLSVSFSAATRARRFSENGQRTGEWNWNRSEQLTDSPSKGSAQGNWPPKGNSVKGGRGDSVPNQDSPWSGSDWPSGEKGGNWDQQPQGNNKGSAYPTGEEGGGDLETLLRGVPGMDFPNFDSIPSTGFDCSAQQSQGYYGDVEAGCQVFHICQPGNRKDSFLCPVGTIFNQKYFVCDWWFNVNCTDTPSFYDLNNEVYKDPVVVTTEATTEMTLPWNAQDLDKKRPPAKSWNNQPANGKKNNGWKDMPQRRGGKSDASREVSNNWSRSDVQQKEVTVSWGSSVGTPLGSFGSSSTASNAVLPTTKPIWYGIDGQPAKDQSNGLDRRQGTVQTPAPFGARMKSSTRMGRSQTWTTEPYPPSPLSFEDRDDYRPSSPQGRFETGAGPKDSTKGLPVDNDAGGWFKGDTPGDSSYPSTTPLYPQGWVNNAVTDDFPATGNNEQSTADGWQANDVQPDFPEEDSRFSATRSWLKSDAPETSIVPSNVEGVWEQESTRRNGASLDSQRHQTSGELRSNYDRKHLLRGNQGNKWGERQSYRNTQSSTSSNRGWFKQSFNKQKPDGNWNANIQRRSKWN